MNPIITDGKYTSSESLDSMLTVGADAVEAAAWASLMISDAQCGAAKQRIEVTKVDRENILEKARKAIEEARRQQEESSFWDDVASFAQTAGTVAAAVAAVTATGGAATPVVALAIAGAGCSLTSEAMRHGWIPGGHEQLFSIGDFELTLGDGLALGGMAAGGAAGGAALLGEGACVTNGFVRGAGVATQAVRAGAAGTQAYATYRRGDHAAAAAELQADAREQVLTARRLATIVHDRIDAIEAATETRSRALQAVASMMETQNAALQAAMGSRA